MSDPIMVGSGVAGLTLLAAAVAYAFWVFFWLLEVGYFSEVAHTLVAPIGPSVWAANDACECALELLPWPTPDPVVATPVVAPRMLLAADRLGDRILSGFDSRWGPTT